MGWRALVPVFMFAITLAMAPVVHGQIQPGNLFGQVLDQQGMPLPGVTLTLEGQGAPQVQVSNAQGEFRFVGIPPSTNHLKASKVSPRSTIPTSRFKLVGTL